MIELFLLIGAAIVAGVFSGLMPGIGGAVMMTILFPVLLPLDPAHIIIFYAVMVSIDQYFNNITAIVFGMPGYSTSVLSVVEGHTMFRRGEGTKAIMVSAVSSWICSMFAVLFIICMVPMMSLVYKVWHTGTQATVFGLAIISLVLLSRNRIWHNIWLFALGMFLAQIGIDELENTEFLTFDLPMLYGGIPTLVMITTLFVVPTFLHHTLKDKTQRVAWPHMKLSNYVSVFRDMIQYRWTMTRSAVIGSVGGFVPGLTFAASSMLSYYTERYLQRRENKYQPGNVPCLIASEGSNNAGAFTQLVPLLFLGIPITVSEIIIFNMLETKGVDMSVQWFQSTFGIVSVAFLFSSTLGLFLAGRYINFLKYLDGIKITHLYVIILFVLFVAIFYLGNLTLNGFDHIMLTIILLPLGMTLHRFDTSPVVFGFLLHVHIFDIAERMYVLYFV